MRTPPPQNSFQTMMDPQEQRKNLERFGELVLADRDLHDQLRTVSGMENFLSLIVRLGSERGYQFSPAVVESALREQRRVWRERWI